MCFLFFVFCFGFSFISIGIDDLKLSFVENRYLAQKPKITFSNIKNGKFSSDLESYLSDQIFLRNHLVALKVDTNNLLCKKLQSDVYFSNDDYLILKYTENRKNLDENIDHINSWSQKVNCPIDLIVVPDSTVLNKELLPAWAITDDQLETINYIDENLSEKVTLYNPVEPLLELKSEGIDPFYKTDIHWTTPAAKKSMEWYLKKSNQKFKPINYETNYIYGFWGYTYSLVPNTTSKSDIVEYYTNETGKYNLEYVYDNKNKDTFFENSFYFEKDKYAFFLGGNFAQINITSNAQNKENVLLIKDSFANSAVTILADQYSNITMVDLRYYDSETAPDVSKLIELYDIDRVIFLYRTVTLNIKDDFKQLK